MDRKKRVIISLFSAIGILYFLLHISFNEPEFVYKTILLILISFFYSIFYLFFNNEKLKISVEFFALLVGLTIFNNPYTSFILIFIGFIVSDLVKKIPWNLIIRRIFIYVAIFFIIAIFFKKYNPQLFLLNNLWTSFLYATILLFFILLIKIIINLLYIILEKKLVLKLFLQNLLSIFYCFIIGEIFILGYLYFLNQLGFVGVITYNIFIILLLFTLQFLSQYSITKRKYKLLLSMMSQIIEKNTLQGQLEAIISAISHYYPIYFTSIWITNYDKKVNELKIWKPQNALIKENIHSLPFGVGDIGKAVETKHLIHIPDTTKDSQYYEGVKNVKSELIIPLIFKNTVLGVIDLESDEKYFFNSFIIDVFKELSFQLSFVLNNTLLYEQLKAKNNTIHKLISQEKIIARDVIQSYEILGVELNEINEKLSEFSQNTKVVDKKIEEIKENEKKIDAKIEEIKQNMDKNNEMIVSTFEKLNTTNDILKSISNISKDSKENVEKIVQNIDNINYSLNKLQEISEKTNILSFNAAIEAARAGQAGKGFAVVANNIKELANKSELNINSTADILNQFKKDLKSLQDLYNNQLNIYNNAKKEVFNLKKNIEGLIENTKNENLNFQNELQNVKQTLENISNLFIEINKISSEIEEIKNKNIQIVERNKVVFEKIDDLEHLISQILETLEEK